MHTLTSKRVQKFARDYGFEGPESEIFERYVAANYLFQYIRDNVDSIENCVIGGGEDEGIDIAAVVVNGQIVFEPSDIDELIADQNANTSKVIFIQAKTSETFDSKLIAKFLHGVESVTKYVVQPSGIKLPPRLVDVAALIDRIAENGDKFQEIQIPCDLYYVTTSSNDGRSASEQLQVTEAMRRINDLGVYARSLRVRMHGHEELSAKQKERHGPRNVPFTFEKKQTIPATERVDEAYIGLLSGTELLKLLKDETGEVRSGVFDDNVRLDLGPQNRVNQRIAGTLKSANRADFPFLNNGLTIIASELRGLGDRFFISGYQIVNGGQTSHQVIRWSDELDQAGEPFPQDVWIPVKIISSTDPEVRTQVTVATNLQTPIGSADIQASSQIAKDVEEYFAQSGTEGLRYERQNRGSALEFARTRVVTTSELNRAVAATLFGESSRAIAAPKDLEVEGSFVWGDYAVEAYYYAAWIIYRIERYFARTPDSSTLKAAKYHIALAVSALTNPKLAPLFQKDSEKEVAIALSKPRGMKFRVTEKALSDQIEQTIPVAVELAMEAFAEPLSEGRSLRKDDVRSRRSQEEILTMVQRKSKSATS